MRPLITCSISNPETGVKNSSDAIADNPNNNSAIPNSYTIGECEKNAVKTLKAIGFPENKPCAISYGINSRTVEYFEIQGDRLIGYHSRFEKEEQLNHYHLTERQIPNWFAHLTRQGDKGANIFIHPNQLQGGLRNDNATVFKTVFAEHDDLSLEEQKQGIAQDTAAGFAPTVQIFSGSKSIHRYWTLSEEVTAEQWLNLMRKAAIAQGSDPAIVTLSRAMRFPEVPRIKGGVTRLTESSVSECTYTAQELESYFDQLIETRYKIDVTSTIISKERFTVYKRVRTDAAEVVKVLAATEESFKQPEYKAMPVNLPRGFYEILALSALEAIPSSTDGSQTYDTLFTPIVRGLKGAGFSNEQIVSILESHSPRKNLYQIVRSINVSNFHSIEKLAKEYGWKRDNCADYVQNLFEPKIREAYQNCDGEALNLALWPLRQSFWTEFKFSDKRWKEVVERVAKELKRKPVYGSDGRRNVGDRLIDAAEYGKRKLQEYCKQLTERAQAKASSFGQMVAAKNPITEAPEVIQWRKGDPIPDREAYRGKEAPKFVYPKGDFESYVALVSGLFEAGWEDLLDTSVTGSGKSHRAGLLALYEQFYKQVYVDVNHNNPSVDSIKRNSVNVFPRHKGLYRDFHGNLTRNKGDRRLTAIKPNCPSTDLFHAQAAKGYHFANGQDHPICGACPMRQSCSSRPDLFKFQYREALKAEFIRLDISQLPKVDGEFEYGRMLGIFEESTQQARACLVKTTGDKGDLLCNLHDLKRLAPEIYEQVEAIANVILDLIDGKQDYYGINHEQVLEALPADLDLEELEQALIRIQSELAPEYDLVEADSVVGAGKEYRQQQRAANAYFFAEAMTANTKYLDNLANCVLVPLLEVIVTGTGAIRIHGEGITVTQPDTRKQQAVQAFKGRLHLDATGDKNAIAAGYGIDLDGLVEIQEELPDFSNATVYLTHLSGITTRNRTETAQQHVAAYKEAVKELNPNAKFLGFKGESDIDGHWFHDNRGSNKFKGCEVLVSLGLPYPNIGAIQDEYRTFNGTLEGWDVYYRQLVQNELIQLVGRPRAQHYPDKAITIDIVASFKDDFDLSFLTERFGLKVVTRDAAEVCSDAGTTREKIKHRILDFAKAVTDAGDKITQKAIAAAMGIAQSTLSEHIKTLWGNWFELKKLLSETLIDTYRESDISGTPSEPIEPSIAAAVLIECFAAEGIAGIRAFLEEMSPPDARYWLGCLLGATASA